MHSAVDTLNQGLLAIGLERSKRKADFEHPYGHGHEMYVFALLAGVGAFCLGSGVAVYHGTYVREHQRRKCLLCEATFIAKYERFCQNRLKSTGSAGQTKQ